MNKDEMVSDALMADAKQFRGERDALRELLRKALGSCDDATTAFEDDPNGSGQWTCHACFAESKAKWNHGSIVSGAPNEIAHKPDCWAEHARKLLNPSAEQEKGV